MKVYTESFTSHHTFCDLNSILLFLLPRDCRSKNQLSKANTTPLVDLRAGCGRNPNCKESVSSVWCYIIKRVSWCVWVTKGEVHDQMYVFESVLTCSIPFHVLGSCSTSGTFVKRICHYPVAHGRWLMSLANPLQEQFRIEKNRCGVSSQLSYQVEINCSWKAQGLHGMRWLPRFEDTLSRDLIQFNSRVLLQ